VEEAAADEMCVEPADDVSRIGDLGVMKPEQMSEGLVDDCFSDALIAA
jgi:hypothetical protein